LTCGFDAARMFRHDAVGFVNGAVSVLNA